MKNKHAIMVLGHGNKADILQKTINILDNGKIDFYIHWDKKFSKPNLKSKKSKIIFVDSIEVTWGTDSQMKAELILIKAVEDAKLYKMAHLISSVDMPLMDVDYFLNYFDGNKSYLGFQYTPEMMTKVLMERVKFFWPINGISLREHRIYEKIIRFVNSLLRINRVKNSNLKIYKGPNWFSINTKYLPKVLGADKTNFLNTFCVDEIFMQTLLPELNWQFGVEDNEAAARYIRWDKKGLLITKEMIPELLSIKNTKFAFARKIVNPEIIDKIFYV